ncbi:hypothetical protein CPB86DRAFT_788917 [Serendipita vermifera]|nr:hypothetical protein CPB86DRAFT_788917 [Serendipita vermifera]
MSSQDVEEIGARWLFDIQNDVLDPTYQAFSPSFGDITKLPTEIWLTIIEMSITRINKSLYRSQFSCFRGSTIEIQTLINVTHACRFLRYLALAHAPLWSEIDLSRNKLQIKSFLKRSAQAPLAITVSKDRWKGATRHLQLLSRYGDRIRGIDMQLDPCDFHLIASWSALEFLHVGIGQKCLRHNPDLCLDLTKHPKLNTISWFLQLNPASLSMLSNAGYRIRRLHLGYFEGRIKAIFLAISSCPNLEELLVEIRWVTDAGDTDGGRPLYLPKLWMLSLTTGGMNRIMRKLDVPAIKDLNIDSCSSPDPFMMLQLPYKDIWPVSLSLDVPYDAHSLIGWLHKEPGVLHSLRLIYSISLGGASECITALAHLNNGKPVCPSLEEISMETLRIGIRSRYIQATGIGVFTPVYWARIFAGSPPLNLTWNERQVPVKEQRWTQELVEIVD